MGEEAKRMKMSEGNPMQPYLGDEIVSKSGYKPVLNRLEEIHHRILMVSKEEVNSSAISRELAKEQHKSTYHYQKMDA